jgi:hypothetical protein
VLLRGIVWVLFSPWCYYEDCAEAAVGLTQDYQPAAVLSRAGEHQINCASALRYTRSKSASCSFDNICELPLQIKTGRPNQEDLHHAIEAQAAIRWVRIHNLPTTWRYFNHSARRWRAVSDLPVYPGLWVVCQYSALTMGWCILLTTEMLVNAKDNKVPGNLID